MEETGNGSFGARFGHDPVARSVSHDAAAHSSQQARQGAAASQVAARSAAWPESSGSP